MPRDNQNSGERSTSEDTGLSFEAEPTGLDETEPDIEGDYADRGRTSPRADFTPGQETEPKSTAARSPVSTVLIAIAVLAIIVVAAMWLF